MAAGAAETIRTSVMSTLSTPVRFRVAMAAFPSG